MDSIFKAYDIRGAYPDELNEAIVEKIGAAFAELLEPREIVVGRDMRLSSSALTNAFIEGVRSRGVSVADVGMCTTPLLYDAIIEGSFDGGAMITASHLPGGINGIKLCKQKAIPLSGTHGLPQIKKWVNNHSNKLNTKKVKGAYRQLDFFQTYMHRLYPFITDPKPLKVVVDVGNGMAGEEVRHIFKKVPEWHLVPMYMRPDGTFPHHVANPLIPENTKDLQARVLEEKADLGVSIDGDADRCGFIDEKGERIHEDLVTALIAEFFLKREPGSVILYDLRSSRIVPEMIKRYHGIAERCRVGHSFIKRQMRKDNALFAGELSGHYYYRDLGFVDNAMMTMIHLLNYLSANRKPLTKLMQPLKKYHSTGEINLKVRKKNGVLDSLAKVYSDGTIDHLDGLSVSYPEWWFNVRKSNTESLLRLNLEATKSTIMQKKRDEVLKQIKTIDPSMFIQSEETQAKG